jgi:hypothetical protein
MTTVNKNLNKIRWRSEVLKNPPRGLGPVISLSWPIRRRRAHPLTAGVSSHPTTLLPAAAKALARRTSLPPSCVDLIEQIDENQSVPTNESTNHA